MENQYYLDKIMGIYGMSNMKKVVKKWHTVSNNITNSKSMPIVLPNLLWRTKAGIGKTNFMDLLSKYLASSNLMAFYGRTKVLEFSMDYCRDDYEFVELRRLMQELNFATGSRGTYKGLLSIELNQWIGHFDSKHFHQLMEFLASRDNDLCILFVLENVEATALEPLENILAQYVRIEKVISDYPTVEELLAYVLSWLSQYDFTLSEGAFKLMKESIATLRHTEAFDGFKTLNLMCEDIAFEILAYKDFNEERVISEEMISGYGKDGIFISRLQDIMTKKQIGFIQNQGGASC